MQRLSLQGPWAYYEQRCAKLEAQLQALAHQNQERVQEVNELSRALDAERQRNKDLVECQVPALQNDSATAQAHARRLQERVQELQTVVDTTNETLSTAHDSLSQEVARLQADNTFLKQSLAKQVSLRTAASAKVEQARKHLGMTSPEAEVLIKELDELRAATKSLRAEVTALTADKSHLQQQCSSRSTHAMTLIAENKRVLEQEFGLSLAVGPLNVGLLAAGGAEDAGLWGALGNSGGGGVPGLVETEVKALLDEALSCALDVIRVNASAHDGLSRALSSAERLEGPELARWLDQVAVPDSLRSFVQSRGVGQNASFTAKLQAQQS